MNRKDAKVAKLLRDKVTKRQRCRYQLRFKLNFLTSWAKRAVKAVGLNIRCRAYELKHLGEKDMGQWAVAQLSPV